MLNKIYTHGQKLILAAGLLFCFVLVRFYEDELFYDPFLNYFRGDYNQMPLPEFDFSKLSLSLLFRYTVNMLISLGLIYVIFKDKMMVRFSIYIYIIAFFVLILSLFLVLHYYGADNNFLVFYIRRFLIQPLFVILFIPAFYYQKRNS
ncbi:exosortase F system-associated membrane protein [Flavobacterium seoulense]|uniref:Exosortase F system-associated protein n=1 Tax=Flavobacterium seoulense TaxID=1492738 RepID=A0A066WN37_9FLAO|nr:exosortase F system-associated protein [Flavobacterium seoulense]KDN55437.1 hypothetical protein FEM21_15640 [Flavobacterium seoulense]